MVVVVIIVAGDCVVSSTLWLVSSVDAVSVPSVGGVISVPPLVVSSITMNPPPDWASAIN